ncbi:MAG: hypothetical protein ACTSSA_09575 [Candidatus Freyarchaeota archaeon]
MAEKPAVRLGEEKTFWLSVGALAGAFLGVWIAHYAIHYSRQT